ncbi:SulP family inorganic anion transporter [Chitiniphilus purpureus]|uniref:SulP family inorganic anion transporter n=1 Tax=Chitiniphilus purpureus TaxID=2981137 RepID=A0ABY6DIY8_9NEIS|nr:SulP family inorganic anion transporter [Chitiniphilus sp. CD1]UXY14325.1 SulP family inorganic anion transporter [Chitiniphilus sp. CD1]
MKDSAQATLSIGEVDALSASRGTGDAKQGKGGILQGILDWRRHAAADFLASIVVFLVALPLCMGIAIASGVPPALGILTGIIGGIFAGILAGSPLLVSGPAAGLAVINWELVQQHGILALGPVVLMAGLLQMVAGTFRLGQWFRAVSPSVIHGMLAGIGVSIVAAQLYIMLDLKPIGNGIRNLAHFPSELASVVTNLAQGQGTLLGQVGGSSSHLAAMVGVFTIVVLLAWSKFAPKSMKLVPAPLVAVIMGALLATVLNLPIRYVNVPSNLLEGVQVTSMASLSSAFSGPLFMAALAMAFIASAETLLSAVAVDKLHDGPRTRYSKELFAQGVGNTLCGLIGALPMTGVIARSSTNVQAGAKSRGSTILHAIWLLLFVSLLPVVLRHIPIASLAAVLIVIGCKLINPRDIAKLMHFGKVELGIYIITLVAIVCSDLLDGVILGIGLAFGKLLYDLLHLDTNLKVEHVTHRAVLKLSGAATFIRLPKLAAVLEKVPNNVELHVNIRELSYIDPACLELLEDWGEQHKSTGGSVVIEWETLFSKYRRDGKRTTQQLHGSVGTADT